MSEMSAEKKKEIEKYILKSYFGGGKNVESLTNGADTVKGTDDGYIPQLIVEVTYFGESGVVMIKWNIYGDSQQNSFAMRVCREREIERNKCDSVDAMRYALEAWREHIQNKPLFLETSEKDKRIEELEKEIKALRAEKEVMERHIQELESHNVSLAETNAVLNNKLNKLDPMPEFKELLKKLYSTDDVEKLVWTLNHTCGGRGSVNGWIAVSLFWKQNYETLSKLVGFSSVEEIQNYLTGECDTLHKAIHMMSKEMDNRQKTIDDLRADISSRSTVIEHYKRDVTRLQKKIDLNAELAKQWEKNYNLLLKRTGFDAVGTLNFYLTNVGCDTLLEALTNYGNKAKALKAENDKWHKATGYLRPEDISTESMISKSMTNEIEAANEELWSENKKCEKRIEALLSEIREWKEGTGCPSPSAAKTMIECMTSWHHAYDDAKKEIESLNAALKTSNSVMQKELDQEITKWQNATGRIDPEAAKQYIDRLTGRLNKIHDYSVDW